MPLEDAADVTWMRKCLLSASKVAPSLPWCRRCSVLRQRMPDSLHQRLVLAKGRQWSLLTWRVTCDPQSAQETDVCGSLLFYLPLPAYCQYIHQHSFGVSVIHPLSPVMGDELGFTLETPQYFNSSPPWSLTGRIFGYFWDGSGQEVDYVGIQTSFPWHALQALSLSACLQRIWYWNAWSLSLG